MPAFNLAQFSPKSLPFTIVSETQITIFIYLYVCVYIPAACVWFRAVTFGLRRHSLGGADDAQANLAALHRMRIRTAVSGRLEHRYVLLQYRHGPLLTALRGWLRRATQHMHTQEKSFGEPFELKV